ncbi:MAG TPA: right-handed parallel beta-helix repeat-containing protein, partial [Chitinophagaceae bacterium]|nr:right-handed parallel beta-helix repeat-containing protein [Chitinophagaceae bacterium]
MKTLLFFILIYSCQTVNATNYYFSSSIGDDNRNSSQAQNPNTPWKTIDKLNTFFSSLQPGDSILFKRGETFFGSIAAIKSGTTSQPIIISTYGSGNKPIITGSATLTNWTSVGNGIWESTSSSLGSIVNTVLLNDAPQEMGRYPNSNAVNKGYLNYESHNANSSITDNELSSSPNWAGAEVVIRKNPWILDRQTITAHTGSTLSYSGGGYNATDNFGYFIQNDIRTLDMIGEWYYNPSLKKINMFFGSNNPSSYDVKVGAVDNLVYINSINNVVFDNLSFKGANVYGLIINAAQNIQVKNCDIIASGDCGIKASNTTSLVVENSFVSYSNNNGIDLENNNNNSIVKGNK